MKIHWPRTYLTGLFPCLGFLIATLLLVFVGVQFVGMSHSLATNGYTPNQQGFEGPYTAGNLPVHFVVTGSEPSVRVDAQGTIYITSIRGVPGGIDAIRWYQPADGAPNSDGTLPFHYLGQPDGCGILSTGCSEIGIVAGGGDSDIAVNSPDPITGVPNVAFSSLTAAPGVSTSHSTDRGNTFMPQPPNVAAAVIPGDDRQWNDAIDAQTVYLTYHDVPTFNIEVQRSLDGGMTYPLTNGFGEAIDLNTFPAAGAVGPQASANIATQIHVDKSECPSRGNLYVVFVAPDSAAENVMGKAPRTAYIGVSTDAKSTAPPLPFTFTDYKIATTAAGESNIFPAVAVDDFGYLYAAWSDNTSVWYSSSSNLGVGWTTPVRVNQGTTIGNSNLFPWLAADENGHVAVVWYGDNEMANSNDTTTLEPCPSGSTTCMQGWAQWSLYVAETVDGHDPVPLFTQTVASDHVIHRGTVSTGGLNLTGGANRNLGDFFQAAMDPQHRINIAFADDHLVNTVAGPDNGPDNPSSRRLIRPWFTRQIAATGGIVTSGVCANTTQAPGGDKITGGGSIGSGTNFGFVANDSPLKGALEYQDKPANLDVHSSNGITSFTASGNCVTFNGNAKYNNVPGYQFSVTACDNGEPGAGKDTLSIQVTGPNLNYQRGGTLTSGNIQLH